jgi:hypothetical protein
MYGLTILSLWLLVSLWQGQPPAPDNSYEIGHAIGFCAGPVLLILIIVLVLFKRARNKRAQK